MVAYGSVEMREQNLKQNICGDRIAPANEPLRLKEFLQVVEGRNHFVAGCHDIVLADNEIQLLAHAIAVFGTGGREMENEERCIRVRNNEWHWCRRKKLSFYALADGEFTGNLVDFVLGRLLKVNPDAALVLVPKYHHSRIARVISLVVHFWNMEFNYRKRSIVARGVSYALVAAVAFGLGITIGESGSSSAIVSHIPLIGDGLDATPDQRADLTDFWKAWNALDANYVITHASSTLPSTKERLFGAIQGLASSYGDPYTVFFPPEEAKIFAESISGSFAGVGMEIDVKDKVLTVIAPLKGTPAEAAGIKAGDLIAAIDGKSTDGISTEKAVSQIRGEIGTSVNFTIIRDGKVLEIEVIRDTIQIPETKDSVDAQTGVYSIALYEFSANSANLFSQAFARFKVSGSRKLLIDLRSNPGGYLDSAVDIASHFLPKGTTIVTEDFGDTESNNVHTSLGYNDVPAGTKVAVLIDGGSASASEIFAGALQDAGVATIIGTQSFGKGSVQTLIDLDKGSLKVTVARWVTPAGHWIMDSGVTPDIIVAYEKADTSEGNDSQVARAIKFLTTGK